MTKNQIAKMVNENKMLKVYGYLIFAIINTKKELNELWKEYILKNISKIFARFAGFVDRNHFCFDVVEIKLEQPTCCPSELSEQINDGLSSDNNFCYCGSSMRVVRLKTDISRYKRCVCGTAYDIITYKSGTFLKICDNTACLCTHEVRQTTQQPLGISCSVYCKNLRLFIHEIINRSDIPKIEYYKIIAQITGRTRDTNHMAQMGISDCMKIIKEFPR